MIERRTVGNAIVLIAQYRDPVALTPTLLAKSRTFFVIANSRP